MKARTLIFALGLYFAWAAMCFAQDPQIGTWKLNEAKSHIPSGLPKNSTVVYEAIGDSVKVSMDGTRDGKPVHTEWTGKFDGKDYPVTGDPNIDSRSYKKIDSHTLASTAKKGGKVITSAHAAVSADGMSRTVNLSWTDSAGKKVTGTAVYDKQ
jgi:hypothetical protein